MKFFVDTADTAEIADLAATGLLDGVTTNPTLIAKSGRDFIEVTKEICGLTHGPVSAEVVALDHEGMMREAEILRKIADNVCIKVPLTIDGLKTCKKLRPMARWSTSRCASRPTRRCWPPRPARPSSRPSWAVMTTTASMAWT
jgi:TalC/MipB family fructose-6-phosphate aldolase